MGVNEDVWYPIPATCAQSATITLYDSTADPGKGTTASRSGYGARFRRIEASITSSRASSTSGFVYAESDNGGTTWITVFAETHAASTDYARDFLRTRKDFRITWTEGGAGSATMTGGVTLIRGDRAAGVVVT